MNPEQIRHLVDPKSYKDYFENPYRIQWHHTMINDILKFNTYEDTDPVIYDLGMGVGCGNYLFYRRAGLGKPIEIFLICHPLEEEDFCKGYRYLKVIETNSKKMKFNTEPIKHISAMKLAWNISTLSTRFTEPIQYLSAVNIFQNIEKSENIVSSIKLPFIRYKTIDLLSSCCVTEE